MLQVIFHGEDVPQLVPDYSLGRLLTVGRIKAFLRSDGWAVVGRDPIREPGRVSYDGPERRKRISSCMACPDLRNGKCVSTTCPSRHVSVKLFNI